MIVYNIPFRRARAWPSGEQRYLAYKSNDLHRNYTLRPKILCKMTELFQLTPK